MRYTIDPEKYLPLLEECGLDDGAKRDLIASLGEVFIKLIDTAWQDDGFAHMKASESRENTAVSGDSVIEYSVYEQSKTTARAAFEAAGASE